jgi:hypothetical protein
MAPITLLASQPWDWLGPLVQAIKDWLFSDAIRELPANAGLFLITGGLSILTLIVSLVFLQSVLPLRSNNPIAVQNLPAERELRPIDPTRPGRVLRPVAAGHTRAVSYHSIDSLLESLLATGLGEPRVLYHAPGSTLLRVYLCPGCGAGKSPGGEIRVCVREKNAIQGAFSTFYRKNASATETKCRFRGDPDCEFEVKH